MQFSILDLESQLLGFPVIKLIDFTTLTQELRFLNDYFKSAGKCYLYVEFPATELKIIHELEDYGFRFSEFRIHLSRDLTTYENYSNSYFPYHAELISESPAKSVAIHLLSMQESDDRFASDPSIPKEFSKKRNARNLEKSFDNFPAEQVIGLFNAYSPALEGFWSLFIEDNYLAHLYQHAVNPSKKTFLLPILDTLVFAYLKEQNIQTVKVVSTGFNISEIYRLITHSGFEVMNSTIILRYSNI
ncbi:MAG: hypothetical protein ACP5O2_11490 [Bacteroidales bacterium]